MMLTPGYRRNAGALRQYKVAIGPLTTPVGGGIRSLNVALRQKPILHLSQTCSLFFGNTSPLKAPENTDMVIFENSEDIYD